MEAYSLGPMENLAKELEDVEVLQESGTVTAEHADDYVVQTESGRRRARSAVSCLMTPGVGDKVLLSTLSSGESFILAVLARESAGPVDISIEGDLNIRVLDGGFNVAAKGDIKLLSERCLALGSSTLKLVAQEGTLVLERLSYLGRFIQSEVGKVKALASTLDTSVDRYSQKVRRAYRTVEEHDQLRAERVDYAAHKTLNLHAENTVLSARNLVKIDGETIHLG